IVGTQRNARKAIEEVIFLVGGVIGADHANRSGAVRVANLFKAARDFFKRVFPAGGLELAAAANEGLANSFGIVSEVVAEAPFAAEELAVDAGMVAIIRAHDFVVADAQGGFAAVGAMRARLGEIFHFPGARLVAIRAAGERTHRAN